jgi:O-antigen/teichoic acid export membrane protein
MLEMTKTGPDSSLEESLPKPSLPPKNLKSQILGGSLTLLAGTGLASVANLVYNVATARMLGPAGFAHATTVYTLLMLLSCVTLSYQVVCAKYVARASSNEERAEIFGSLHQRSWIAGIGLGLLLFLLAGPLTEYLNLPNPVLIYLLAMGTAFYIPLGVRRGYIQGIHAFRPLAFNFLFEGVVRLGGAVLLIGWGMGVRGAVLASALASILSYFAALPSPSLNVLRWWKIAISFKEGLQAIVFFSGQTVINNFDIVLVKHFFPPAEAGFYAAVALVGRVINMCAWSVVNTMFPVSAGEKNDDNRVLLTSLLLVSAIVTCLILGLWMVPSFVWKVLFGAHLQVSNQAGLSSLLILYAVKAGIYSLSSVLIAHEISRKVANTSWLQLALSGVMALGICALHQTLRELIVVQLVLMIVLLLILVIPLFRQRMTAPSLCTYSHLRLLRALSEEEVMSEFLRSEFHHPEFDDYREEFDKLVRYPDLNSSRENAVRQALLFLRRGAMWRELPTDTQWFEVELTAQDLSRVRFFPRANWRRLAQGSFHVTDLVPCIRLQIENAAHDEFLDKIRSLVASVQENVVNPTVLLIGVDEASPLTILDGNHRVAAAMLGESLAAMQSLRYICGLSPAMTRCCWYSTNVNTLLRYLKNLVRYVSYDPQTDIGRFQKGENKAVPYATLE